MSNERIIRCFVMDRTGDTRTEQPVSEAIELARKEMAAGKWLRTVDAEGESNIIRDIKDLKSDEAARQIFEGVEEMQMMAALVGG